MRECPWKIVKSKLLNEQKEVLTKNSPLVRTPLQLVVRTSWQTSAYLTTQMPIQGLTSSASQTLDSKPTEHWVNSNTLRCNTSFEATPMLKLRERLVSVLFAKFSFYAWITDGKQRCLIQGDGIRRLLFTEACRQVNMALIWHTRTKLTDFAYVVYVVV